VTDGTDSFYGSRSLFQVLHDVGDFSSLTAFSSSTVDAKKMCISRQARYSGLIDVLQFAEGGDAELAAAFSGMSTWVVVNGVMASLPAQVAAAGQAGVKRIFVHIAAADSGPGDAESLKAACDASGATYTVMRTGAFSKSGSGGGLILGDLALPSCDEVSIDDTFRFIVDALAIPEAAGRLFSLCPSVDDTQLREMRMAGCTRKEEAEALLKGVIVEKKPEERQADQAAAKAESAKDDDPRSDEEKAAAAEDEVKMLLARAKEKGVETQKRLAAEEEVKAAKRAERLDYFAQNNPDSGEAKGDDEGEGGAPKGEGGDSGGDKPKKDGDDDDDDGLALV